MGWMGLAVTFLAVFAATGVATAVVLKLLRRRAILDRPNHRSSHTMPTPRGGGIAVMGVLLPAWAAIALASETPPPGFAIVLAAALVLAVVSWIDDIRSLGWPLRLAVQLLAVALGLVALADNGPLFQGYLPPWLDHLAAAFLWLWFVNLFNFMDGIDGMAGMEAACLGGGLALVALASGWSGVTAPLGLAMAAAALGFLVWNWPPAKLFLGDVGSVPLGYLLGWLLLDAAAAGAWAVALILPAYYLADATITLLRRLSRGERIFEAHDQHFYQQAVRSGSSHGEVVRAVLFANLVLIALALGAARGAALAALVGAAATVAVLLRYLLRELLLHYLLRDMLSSRATKEFRMSRKFKFKLSAHPEIAFLHDVAMAAVSFVLSLYLRLGDEMMAYAHEFLPVGTMLFTGVAALVFRTMGLYRGVWRYASMDDLLAIARAVTLIILIFLPLMFLVTRLEALPRSVLVINWFVLMCLLGAPRLLYRVLKDGSLRHVLESGNPFRVPVLLIGAGNAADAFIRELARDKAAPFKVLGILDDKPERIGRRIRGVTVNGNLESAQAVIEGLRRSGRVPQRFVVTRRVEPQKLRRLLSLAEANGMTLARLPRITELKQGGGEAETPLTMKPIAVEDLLGRPRTVLDRTPMQRLVAGRRVLVTGAGGSIGSELVRQIADFAPAHVSLLDHAEFLLYEIDREVRQRWPELSSRAILADVRDRARIDRVMLAERPDLVFHAAALKHVPMAELNAAETTLTNVMGTCNLAEACRAAGAAAMVLISTDKAVNPTSVLGATKRLAESYCQALDIAERSSDGTRDKGASGRGTSGRDARHGGTRYITVRFGNVLGSAGSVVPLFQRQLAEGGPLTVTHPDMTRYFMTIREAVELVLQASALGSGLGGGAPESGKIFVLDMGEPVKVLDLAQQMIRLSGKRPGTDVEIRFTGMRPGEKLTEELFHSGETLEPTPLPGILLAGPRTADWKLLRSALDELAEAAAAGRTEQVLALLQRLVPEYAASAPPPLSAVAAS